MLSWVDALIKRIKRLINIIFGNIYQQQSREDALYKKGVLKYKIVHKKTDEWYTE